MKPEFRVLICGDREWTDRRMIRRQLEKIKLTTPHVVLIEGECRGADLLARGAAESLCVRVRPFPADWKQYGKAAGPIRNEQMLREGQPHLVLAFHDHLDQSVGTRDMLMRVRKAGVQAIHFHH